MKSILSQTMSRSTLTESGVSSTATHQGGPMHRFSGGMTTDPPCSGYGHDKSRAILPYRDLPNPPTLFFFGDGVSGMCSVIVPIVWNGPFTNDQIRYVRGET